MNFQQEDFQYHDLYSESSFLSDVLKYWVPSHVFTDINNDLAIFSKKASGSILKLMWEAERNQPSLTQYDHWGRRVDELVVSRAWDDLHKVAADSGIVSIGYERKSAESSRLHQFLKLMLFHPSSAFYSCPLAMTDGAALVLEKEKGALYEKYFHHLISRDPEQFWTAGQWMTEKSGGSDVSQSETVAEIKDGRYFLTGTKWFTSAVTADIALTLAKTKVAGKEKLSMFLVRLRDQDGNLKNIEVLRLKDKMGTKAMPTAELQLKSLEGHLIGDLGEGVKNISTVLNVSRLYNAVCATGTVLRLHSLATDFSHRRVAFGKKLIDHPLHQRTLLETEADLCASVHFVSYLGVLLGRSETNKASDEDLNMLRLFTPIAKMWTAKKSVQLVSELIEVFGGAGYIEDTHLPRFLRDAQVFPIWEGTTNIMSLDTLRAISKEIDVSVVFQSLENRMKKVSEKYNEPAKSLGEILQCCKEWLHENQNNGEQLQYGARSFSLALGNILCGLLMIEFADHTKKSRDQVRASIFIDRIEVPKFKLLSGISIDEIKQAIQS